VKSAQKLSVNPTKVFQGSGADAATLAPAAISGARGPWSDTPKRVGAGVKEYCEGYGGKIRANALARTFEEVGGYESWCCSRYNFRSIPKVANIIWAPIIGRRASLICRPTKVVGISKLGPRASRYSPAVLQVHGTADRRRLRNVIWDNLKPHGVLAVVIEASHSCMTAPPACRTRRQR